MRRPATPDNRMPQLPGDDLCPATGEAHSYANDFAHYQKTGETGLFICECGARPSKAWLDNYDPTPE